MEGKMQLSLDKNITIEKWSFTFKEKTKCKKEKKTSYCFAIVSSRGFFLS